MFNFNKQSGQVARLLLVLAVVVLVAIGITYLIIKMAEKPTAPPVNTEPEIPLPVYEQQLGNIRFVFQSARDLGSILKASDVQNIQYSSQKDVTTTEKFVEITIGAQNTGKDNIENGAWTMGNIVDADGRNFVPVDEYIVHAWLPVSSHCGSLLKPAFNPTPCTKIYEVAKGSTGLKVIVKTGKDNLSSNLSSGKVDEAQLDLIVK